MSKRGRKERQTDTNTETDKRDMLTKMGQYTEGSLEDTDSYGSLLHQVIQGTRTRTQARKNRVKEEGTSLRDIYKPWSLAEQ